MLAPEDESRALQRLRFSLASDIIELVILTSDEVFLQTLREAVGPSRRLWHVLSSDKISDLLVAGGVGILVLDAQALHEPAPRFIADIKRQFPDLVVVVAGTKEAENELARLISDGSVYRFIHKPMSPARARLFVDAAVKRHDEQGRRGGGSPAAARAKPPGRMLLIGAGCTAGCIALASLWLSRGGSEPQGEPGGAAAALLESRAPAAPAPGPTHGVLDQAQDRLLARAQNALQQGRLDEAAATIDAARKAGVESERVASLAIQLAKARARRPASAGAAPTAPSPTAPPAAAPPAAAPPAAAPLAAPPAAAPLAAAPPSPVSSSARAGPTKASPTPASPASPAQTAAAPAAADSPAERSAALALERIQDGRLIEPEDDNARFYLEEALKADPNSGAAQQAEQALALALLGAARSALERRDFAQVSSWLEAARGIAAPANLDNLRQALATAQRQAASDAAAQLLKSAELRLSAGRLVDPADDSAKHYLTALRAVDPQNTALAQLTQDLGARLVAKARSALASQRVDEARGWLDQAGSIGYASPELEAARHDLDAALAHQHFLGDVVGANQLVLVKSVQPDYPGRARNRSIEGWVDLEFTVSESGAVTDVAVRDANPRGVFEQSATAALLQWRYKPVLRDSKPAAQRARIRIRFALGE